MLVNNAGLFLFNPATIRKLFLIAVCLLSAGTVGWPIFAAAGQLSQVPFVSGTNKADPHCRPTAGKVTGSYKIIGKRRFDLVTNQYSSTFKIVTKQYTRTPVSTGEMSTNFAK